MSGTPRLRSAFPQTPKTSRKALGTERRHDDALATPRQNKEAPQREAPAVIREPRGTHSPLIPFDIIDAPSQRLYVVAFYIALHTWRFYEYWESSDELDSTWLFLKWVSIDALFFFGLPSLRIPWLEWAFSTSLAVFLLHAVINGFLMFHIPVPIAQLFRHLSLC